MEHLFTAVQLSTDNVNIYEVLMLPNLNAKNLRVLVELFV
jgi:hypothetical protein